MSTNHFERARALFDRCLELTSDEWERVLDAAGEEADVIANVRRMLAHHSDTAAIESGFMRLDATDPERIGPYRVLQRLGEGGMGIVYAAEQREPVRRRVAIKVLRQGHGSREVLARFDVERQALALMNHPNIAHIVDAGTTVDHRPYIVMEFVPGEPLIRYCNEHELPLKQRLDLFCDACDAVQHAHQRGVIHRDLKPSNILVMENNGEPTVKIIDFGIAKAISQRLTDHTLETRVGSLLGTPDYMSPEQAELSPLDVDTRADVYALGAVLYELLAGQAPLGLGGSGKTYSEMLRIIQEQQPVPPSQRLEGAAKRQVRGDLDWIALKALEKQRIHRYGSPAELAADVRNHLADRVVSAGPPSTARRLGKFLRRHWFGSAATLAIVSVITISQVLLVQKNRELQLERDRANHEKEIAHSVTAFTASLFELASPQETGQPDISARALLDAGVRQLEQRDDSPEVRAALYEAASKAYHGIGAHEEAERLATVAVDIFRALGVSDVEAFAGALIELAHAKREDGQFDEAEAFGREAVEVAQASGDRALLYRAQVDLADSLRKNSKLQEAVAILEALRAGDDGDIPQPDRSDMLSLLGRVYVAQGRFDEAEPLLMEAIAAETLDDGTLTVRGAIAKSGAAALYSIRGDIERAIRLRQELVDAAIRRYGDVHFEVSTAWNNLAFALLDVPERLDEAEAALLKALDIKYVTVGENHPSVQTTRSNLAWLYGETGRWTQAHAVYSDIVRIRETLLGPGHVDTAVARIGLGRSLIELGQPELAERTLATARASLVDNLGERHWRVGAVTKATGDALLAQRRHAEARAAYMQARDVLLEALGPEHSLTRDAIEALQRLDADGTE